MEYEKGHLKKSLSARCATVSDDREEKEGGVAEDMKAGATRFKAKSSPLATSRSPSIKNHPSSLALGNLGASTAVCGSMCGKVLNGES
uniref:Uncharacterized protein n=1 Tax=Romanomermis culicivorax TaxID=13658 RepID=A0A915JEM7_ROMCU